MARQVKARATQPDNVIDVQNSCGEDRKLIPATSPLSHVCAHIQSPISWKIDCMTSEKRSHPIFYWELDPCILTDVRNPLESLSTDRTSLAYLKLLSCWRSTFLTLFLSAHHCPRGFQSPDIIRAMGIHTSEHWWRNKRSVPFSSLQLPWGKQPPMPYALTTVVLKARILTNIPFQLFFSENCLWEVEAWLWLTWTL